MSQCRRRDNTIVFAQAIRNVTIRMPIVALDVLFPQHRFPPKREPQIFETLISNTITSPLQPHRSLSAHTSPPSDHVGRLGERIPAAKPNNMIVLFELAHISKKVDFQPSQKDDFQSARTTSNDRERRCPNQSGRSGQKSTTVCSPTMVRSAARPLTASGASVTPVV